MSCVPWSNETERADYYKSESSRLYRIEERLEKEKEQLNDILKHEYQKSNIAVKGYNDLKQRYEELQKENAELKKEVKLWEQGRESIANQAKLVEKISFENSKKYFDEKAKNYQLVELLKLAINDLKTCADDNGGCYGCKNLDLAKDECICEEGKLLCNSVDNNMWQWQHADKLRELGVEVG